MFACYFRYLAICYSRHSKITTCKSRATIFFIWVFSAAIMIPQAVYFQMYMHPDYPTIPMCHQLWPSFNIQRAYFLIALFILCYVVPLIMILLCYVLLAMTVWKRNAPGIEESGRLVIYRSKVKVLKMLAVIVVLFALSWLPLYAVYLRLYFGDVQDTERQILFDIIIPIAQWLGSSNCGVNPLIYCFFSKKYRRGFSNILHCRCLRFPFRRRSRSSRSLSTRYMNVDNSSCNRDHNHEHTNRIASNKFMVVAFCNGKMTVSFRKENGSDESSF